MKTALYIGLGGFLGALCRHGLSTWIGRSGSAGFNTGILTVNVIGCFIFGLVFGLAEASGSLSKELRMFLLTGFLGAFTTFSTFGHDTVTHFKNGHHTHALGNIALSVCLGLFAAWLGLLLSSLISKS